MFGFKNGDRFNLLRRKEEKRKEKNVCEFFFSFFVTFVVKDVARECRRFGIGAASMSGTIEGSRSSIVTNSGVR